MTKRRFIALLLLTLFAVGYAGSADAQFWKRKKHKKHHKQTTNTTTGPDSTGIAPNEEDTRQAESATNNTKTKSQRKKERKEQKRREKRERKERERRERQEKKQKKKKKQKGTTGEEPAVQVPVVRKWADIEYAETKKKPRYRIDILAPMYLDELVKNGYAVKDIPEKALPGINFYKGVQIAADTLKKAQFDIDIYVHDVSSLMESTDALIRKNAMDSSDLIIGAVVSRDVPSLAAYAKSRQINFISALSPSDGNVRDNQYFTLLQPSLKSHCEWIAASIENSGTKRKAVLFYRTTVPAEENAYRYLTDDAAYAGLFNPIPCNSLPVKETLAAVIDTSRACTIVVSVLDNNYADSLLKILRSDFPRTHFDIYGMPSWSSMAGIAKPGMFPNMTISITAPFNFETMTPQGVYVERTFRKEYGSKPQEMVYRGYEAMFWYANMLMRHGTIFNKQYDDNETAPFTRFEMKPQWDKAGNVLYLENRHLFERRYDNGTSITK